MWRSSIQSAKRRPGAECGSDHEILIAKFRLKWKKVRETVRPFRYDLNQIPYDYTEFNLTLCISVFFETVTMIQIQVCPHDHMLEPE